MSSEHHLAALSPSLQEVRNRTDWLAAARRLRIAADVPNAEVTGVTFATQLWRLSRILRSDLGTMLKLSGTAP
jgi:hypothetical protein